MAKMREDCSWCGNTIGFKTCTDEQDGKISHGICPSCLRKHFPEEASEILKEEEITLPPLTKGSY